MRQAYLRDLQQWLDRCQRIGTAELSQTLDWIGLAARNGSVLAMHLYRMASLGDLTAEEMLADPIALERYRERSLNYLFAAVNAGDSNTLLELADVYRRGVLATADPTLAYAYALDYFETGEPTDLARALLNQFGKNLSDTQRSRGRQLADQILHACCQ